MNGPKIRLGKLLGITFQIDPTWFVVFTLITLSLTSRFNAEYPHWTPLTYWIVGILTSILFFVSVVLHYLAQRALVLFHDIAFDYIIQFVFWWLSHSRVKSSVTAYHFLLTAADP